MKPLAFSKEKPKEIGVYFVKTKSNESKPLLIKVTEQNGSLVMKIDQAVHELNKVDFIESWSQKII